MKVVYRYNTTSKDVMSTTSVSANETATEYESKGWITCICLIKVHRPHRIWVKSPNSQCTTNFKKGNITNIVNITYWSMESHFTLPSKQQWQVTVRMNHLKANC